MSKTMQWVIGILAVLAVGGAITMLILWDKEKKKNAAANKAGGAGGAVGAGTSVPRTDAIAGDAGTGTGTAAGTVARFSN